VYDSDNLRHVPGSAYGRNIDSSKHSYCHMDLLLWGMSEMSEMLGVKVVSIAILAIALIDAWITIKALRLGLYEKMRVARWLKNTLGIKWGIISTYVLASAVVIGCYFFASHIDAARVPMVATFAIVGAWRIKVVVNNFELVRRIEQ